MERKHTCEHCGGRIAYDGDAAGTRANCPHCSVEITLGVWENPTQAASPSARKAEPAPVWEVRSNRNSRPLVWAVVCGFVLLCAVIAGSAYYVVKKRTAQTPREDRGASVQAKSATPAQEESTPSKQPEEPSPESAEGVFKAFAQCTTTKDILKFIQNPDDLRERVNSYYAKLDLTAKDNLWKQFQKESEDRKIQVREDGSNSVWVSWHTGKNVFGNPIWSDATYYMSKVEWNWKIDWLSSVRWSAMSAKEFLLTKPKEPTEMRVTVKLRTNFDYIADRDRELVWPLTIAFSKDETKYQCFVRRDNQIGREIYTALKDAKDDARPIAWTLFVRFQGDTLIEVVDGWRGWRHSKRPAARVETTSPAPASDAVLLASGSKPGTSAGPTNDTASVPPTPKAGGMMLAGQSPASMPAPLTPGETVKAEPKPEPKPLSGASAIQRSLAQADGSSTQSLSETQVGRLLLGMVDRYNQEVASYKNTSATFLATATRFNALGDKLKNPGLSESELTIYIQLRSEFIRQKDLPELAKEKVELAHDSLSKALELFKQRMADTPPEGVSVNSWEEFKANGFRLQGAGSYLSLQNAPQALGYLLEDRKQKLDASTATKAVEADKKTVEMLKTRVKAGSDYAQYELALRHIAGKGVPKDEAEAIRLLRLSAASGYSKATKKLTEMDGTPK